MANGELNILEVNKIKESPVVEEIITTIDNCYFHDKPLEWYEWLRLEDKAVCCMKSPMGADLHSAMQPYYNMYVWADEWLFHYSHRDALKFIQTIINTDDNFGVWMAKNGLINITERWIQVQNTFYFFSILTRLVELEYVTDWENLYRQLSEKLDMLEVYGDATSGEFYCILHGFTMIMMTSMRYNQRQQTFELFKANWGFLKHMYCVMVKRIIGFGFNNFVQVANNVKSTDNQPYLHLIHAALIERADVLCSTKAKHKKLEKQLADIEDIMHRTAQSDELDALCKILFPEELCQMLVNHRHQSYVELQGEVRNLQNLMRQQSIELNAQIERMADELRRAMVNSIPIGDIERELLDLDPQTAMTVFEKLHLMLAGNEVWMRNVLKIRNAIRTARKEHEKKIEMTFNAPVGQAMGVVEKVESSN